MTAPVREGSGPTPRPWAVGGDDGLLWITPPNTSEAVICDLVPRDADSFTEEDEANAAFIVLAVNNHDALVEALRDLFESAEAHAHSASYGWVDHACKECTESAIPPVGEGDFKCARHSARSVLSAVEGDKEEEE